jgi:hypothetical protein
MKPPLEDKVPPLPPALLPAGWTGGLVLAFAMTFPAVMTWVYFVALAHPEAAGPNRAFQVVYSAGKSFQFLLPVLYVGLVEGWRWRLAPPSARGVKLGLAFGLVVAGAVLGLYYGFLRDGALVRDTPHKLRLKLADFGLETAAGFLLLATFLSVAHSLLEEYYWRWFVFGRLRSYVPRAWAIGLSSVAFMAHHVVVLDVYFPGRFWTAAVPFALGVAVGGAVWAWLYDRTGSLAAPWLSHLLVDAAIMAVGYDLVFGWRGGPLAAWR